MEFLVLGPLTVVRDGRIVEIGGPRQRIVLAMMLLSAPQAVSVDTLVDAVWSKDPPATAREQIHICISNLRRSLNVRTGPVGITTRVPGYAIELGEVGLDLHQFDVAVRVGRTEAAAGNLDAAATALNEALSLWRGKEALVGMDSPLLRDYATRLGEQRVAVLEDYADLALRRGQHRELVNLLGAEIDRNPLRER